MSTTATCEECEYFERYKSKLFVKPGFDFVSDWRKYGLCALWNGIKEVRFSYHCGEFKAKGADDGTDV